MVSDFFMGLGEQLITWALGLWPVGFTLPEWFLGFAGLVSQVLTGAVGMGVWIPWASIFTVVGATFALWGIGLLLKFARWVVGLVPTMGGG